MGVFIHGDLLCTLIRASSLGVRMAWTASSPKSDSDPEEREGGFSISLLDVPQQEMDVDRRRPKQEERENVK